MEYNIPKIQNCLNIKSKSQLNFSKHFSKKIQDLKIFIYGLKGVIQYLHNYSLINNLKT